MLDNLRATQPHNYVKYFHRWGRGESSSGFGCSGFLSTGDDASRRRRAGFRRLRVGRGGGPAGRRTCDGGSCNGDILRRQKPL